MAFTETSPPAYRMPPPALAPPGAEPLPGTPHAAPAPNALRTHSAKFPIEREVVVPGGCGAGAQVRGLGAARRAAAASAAVAPDAPPPPAVAWTHAQQERATAASPAVRTPRAVARTYHTLRGIISNKLRSRDAGEPTAPHPAAPAASAALNNADHHVNSSTPTHGRELTATPSLATPTSAHPQEGAGCTGRALCADALYGPPPPRRPHPDQRALQADLRAPHPDPRSLTFTSLKPAAMHAQFAFNSQSDLSRSRPDLRSPQQLAREMIRQRGLAEGRRAASHPHLLAEPHPVDQPPRRPLAPDDRDSDDGGFRARLRAQGRSSFEDRNRSNAPPVERVARAVPCTPDPAPRRELIAPPTHSPQSGCAPSSAVPTTAPATASGSGASSDYDKTGGQSSNVDSGRGSVAYSSGRRAAASPHDTSAESDAPPAPHAPPPANTSTPTPAPPDTGGGDGEWADVVENELRQILEPRLAALRLHSSASSGSSVTPPLPPLSPPDDRPRSPSGPRPRGNGTEDRRRGRESPRWNSHKKHSSKRETHYKRHLFGLDTPELTSTTTRSLDLSSLLDARSDSDVSAGDARAIRRQLRGLENMYAEVLQLLGVRKPVTYRTTRAHRPQWDGRPSASSMRRYGSASSLPSSSASGRPPRERRRVDKQELKNINKRFQRLEAHVVTLARSVAHLSSEMRTQHMVVREMESVRAELAALRALCGPCARAPVASPAAKGFTDPARVRRLTKFFGDEPPLMRLFLKRLGYEKYAHLLEREKVGAAELPYVGEERLRALGLPLGPRARILREAGLAADMRDRDRDCTATTLAII
ncbi:hypothetical protein EVAR_23285_1 [Eumeta japonica]|uniref:SAM domain-containing protein n=1 Tax=Eumeta variegata TaxID=151549 RepID=A0A4C1V542_EUMVA|nr:hypothetical protein EVAR_23285_1 [Eumeta japonica]